MMRLTVIIVAYNSEDFIEDCVRSLLENLPEKSEIIVIDNNSSDNTAKKLENFVPKIDLIKSTTNLGFAKANNLAAKKVQGNYLFFLNPDTQITGSIFNELLGFYERESDAGIVAPKLIQPDGKVQESVKNLPTIWRAIKEFIFLMPHAYSQFIPKDDDFTEVESVYGAAMLIKRDLFNKVGGFDERFFLYYEDVDLCKRIRKLGKKIYYYPKVSIKHIVGGTKSERNKYELNMESFIKYHGRFKAMVLQMIFMIPRVQRKLGLT